MQNVEKKTNYGFLESKDKLESLQSTIALKKSKCEEELYTKTTLSCLITKMKEEILILKKNILEHTQITEKHKKELEFQTFKKNEIKEKWNKLHSSMENMEQKNLLNKKENDNLVKYYGTVLDQKKCFQMLV